MMMRFFCSKPNKILEKSGCISAASLANSAQLVCKKLDVASISGQLKIVDYPTFGEKSVVSTQKYYSVFNDENVATKEEIIANAKVLKKAQRNAPSW